MIDIRVPIPGPKSLRVIDINEINPELDVNGQTVKLGTKILGEILGN